MYFFQPFRCKKSNEITKSGSICLFQKLDSSGAPKPTLGPKTPLKYPRRAEIGINASHAVQLTSFGPKKPDSNRSPQRSVPFTWNHPPVNTIVWDCPPYICLGGAMIRQESFYLRFFWHSQPGHLLLHPGSWGRLRSKAHKDNHQILPSSLFISYNHKDDQMSYN